MKQLLNIILLCGLSLTISAQDWSYVKTRTMTNAGGTTYLDHFDYDNGLGQTHQQIDVNFTPNHNNLVTLIEYDDYRRPAQVWLPVEMSGSGVMNDNTVKSTATTFYSNSMPYTKNIYEQSPLERIKQRYLPGQEWYNAGKSQQTDWYTNTSSNPEGNALVLTMNQSTLSFSSTSQKYWIEKTTDEDDRKVITFTDLSGQVAAVRNYDSTPLTTYYAYDDFGDLRYVLPPEVADYYEGNPSQSLSPTRLRIPLRQPPQLYLQTSARLRPHLLYLRQGRTLHLFAGRRTANRRKVVVQHPRCFRSYGHDRCLYRLHRLYHRTSEEHGI